MAEIPLGAGGPAEDIQELAEQLDIVEVPEQSNVTELEDGSAIIGELPEEEGMPSEEIPFDANLADFIDDAELGRVSDDLSSSIKDDISSRDEWEQIYKSGLELLGIKYEDRTEPFEGATGVIHPLLSESVTQFQAQASRS